MGLRDIRDRRGWLSQIQVFLYPGRTTRRERPVDQSRARIDGLHRGYVMMRRERQSRDDLAPQQRGENQLINQRVLSESYLIGCDDS